MDTPDTEQTVLARVDEQITYSETSARTNRRWHLTLKRTATICNILTTMTIALAFTVPTGYKTAMSVLALVLSTVVLGTYQWQELENYGAKWERFRLVAERLKSEKHLFLNRAGPYALDDHGRTRTLFVETVERLLRGTDNVYFSFMVESGRRVEKRVEQDGQAGIQRSR